MSLLSSAHWLATAATPDSYVAFRLALPVARAGRHELRVLGANWFALWLDGRYLAEGPHRYPPAFPEYQSIVLDLEPGRHLLAAKVAHAGVSTRLLENILPFLAVELLDPDGKPVELEWRALQLEGYQRTRRQVNVQLGWVEWADTRLNPAGWTQPEFDDSAWAVPGPQRPEIGTPRPASIGLVQSFRQQATLLDEGPLAEVFGYQFDDPAARFFLRDLTCEQLPVQGCWRRYDLGRVRLMKPDFLLRLPAGAIVEFAYCEALMHERVSPWISLSSSTSCNLDHFVARGGVQDFCPLQPKGGRFVELHILNARPEEIGILREDFIERGYYDAPVGAFACGDAQLETIWQVGVETFRACAEDGIIDNPTRERGQWTGDVVSVGMDIGSVAYADMSLIRRGLVQSAQCAREDGLVAGLCPGGAHYHPTYSAQWINACLHYWEVTGERELLEELWPAAVRNLAAFEPFMNDEGVGDEIGHIFIDWGYARNKGPADLAFNLHYYSALQAMTRWARELNHASETSYYERLGERIGALNRAGIERALAAPGGWRGLGYHSTTLALACGLIPAEREDEAMAAMREHILSCFPNDPQAPRNAAPEVREPRLITPYFAHYAFPVLIERGQMDFVLEQYARCWGWALGEGRTTWVEVFDTRWTHCHQWAGCPTWQLSRYGLGLHPRFDLGRNHYVHQLQAGALQWARGVLPISGSQGTIAIDWRREGEELIYEVAPTVPIWIHPLNEFGEPGEAIAVSGPMRLELAGRLAG